MQDIHDKIAFLIEEQFPDFYHEDGPNLIDFVKGYFEFLEEHDKTTEAARNLFTERDVDTATDEFIEHFRAKYLNHVPKINTIDDALLIKNIQSIYKSKGSQQAISSLLRLMFNQEATVEYPGDQILRPSSSEWVQPRYLELQIKDKNTTFIGKEIKGATSGAKAFVENIARMYTKDNRQVDIAFLSGLRGIFQTNELISDKTGDTVGSPKIIGSLSSLDIINGGANFNIGDEFDIISTKGIRGKARVTATIDDTGRVAFTLVDGGTGYTLSTSLTSGGQPMTEIIISNNVVIPTVASFANNLTRFMSVKFPYASIDINENHTEFTIGDTITLYDGVTNIANTLLVSKLSSNTLVVSIESNTAAVTDTDSVVVASNTAANATVVAVTDATVSANVTGQNSTAFGVHDYQGGNTIYANGSHMTSYNYNGTTQATGTVSNVSSGSGATFNIGALTGEESIEIFLNKLSGYNDANTIFIRPTDDGSSYDGINTANSISIAGLAPVGNTQISNGTFQDVFIVAGGSGYTTGDTITVDKTKYANGSAVDLADQATSTAAITINAVDGGGAITQVTLADGGEGFDYLPQITITGGTSAELLPVLGYGFPKLATGNLTTILDKVFDSFNGSLGTISGLSGINPGSGYNFDPFVVVWNPYIASYDVRNQYISLQSVSGTYVLGETVQAQISTTAPTLTTGSEISSGLDFTVGEGVIQSQGATSATGIVVSWNSGTNTLKVEQLVGTFDGTNSVKGTSSGAEYNVTNINTSTTVSNFAKGKVVARAQTSSYGLVLIQPTSFYSQYNVGNSLVGQTSGASGVIRYSAKATDVFSGNYGGQRMGDNAVITAKATVADDIATQLTIVDSGVGFVEGEQVTLQTTGNPIVITANTRLGTAGTQAGYWRTEKHFLSSDSSFIQDNDYYQEYSYVVKTGSSLERYEEALKYLLHVSGTKLFGEVLKVGDVDGTITAANSSITTEV